ncbi:MAG: protein kinase [Polyangiaceae bacterium]
MEDSAAVAARPTRLGPYRVTGLLGQGGMGVVLEGEHEETGERVALKTVRLPSAAHLAGLRREIQALSRVKHPGVVRIVGEGVRDSLPWYAMELLRGPTLADRIRSEWTSRIRREQSEQPTLLQPDPADGERTTVVHPVDRAAQEETIDAPWSGPLTEAFAGDEARFLAIFRRLCDTLAFLHGEGIVHRDLKPENIFLREDDTPVMVDFGLVGRGSEAREVLDLQILAGTPEYIAPEQLAGQVVDARADLYAVGCILYEVATGRVPYEGASLSELRTKLTSAPVLPSARVTGLSVELEDLMLRLLAPAPRDRVGHASDVVRVLARQGAEPWPVEVPAARGYVYRPALAGRDEALARMRGGLKAVLGGRGGLWLLRGESGVGKTYLAMAAARDASLAGARPVVCACEPLGVDVSVEEEPAGEAPLTALAPVFQALVDACLEDPARAEQIVGKRARVLAVCAPAIAELPCFEAAPEPPELPQAAARERLFGALAESLAALSSERPIVLFVDDLQWADELSAAFIESLKDQYFQAHRVLVVGVYRSEEATPALERIARREDVVTLEIGRLGEREVAAMVGDMLAQAYVPPSFAAFLTERSEGNPFFVVEYVRTAVAEGLLLRTETGAFSIREGEASWGRIPLPTSLSELVQRRLSGLGEDAREVLSAACVIGREVEVEVLALMTRLGDAARDAAVRELVLRYVLEDAEGGLRFVHDKIRRVAYEALSAARRRELHASAGAATLSVHGGHDATVYGTLAHHFTMADDVPRALEFLERAGEHALSSHACREASGFLKQAVALSDRRSGGARPPAAERLRRVRWERQLSEACFGMGDVNGMLEHAERALSWAGVKAPSSGTGWLASLAWNLPVQLAHRLLPERFVAKDETARAIFREAAAAMQRLAQRSYFLDANAMIAGSLWSANLAERAGGAPRVSLSYSMLGLVSGIARLRRPAEAYFALARRSAAGQADSSGLVDASYAEATWRSGQAEWSEVYRLLGEAALRAHEVGDENQENIVRTVLANTDFFTGKLRESRARLEEVATDGRRHDNPQLLAWGLYGMARADVPLGDLSSAESLLAAAEEVLAPQAELPSKIICHALTAVVRLRLEDRSGALSAARTALARISENRLAAYAIVAACADVAFVMAELSEALPEARSGARAAVRALGTLSLALPLAGPYRAHAEASVAMLSGERERAARCLSRALGLSKRLGLPYEEARAHLGLSRVAPDESERREHRRAAERAFAELGCPVVGAMV